MSASPSEYIKEEVRNIAEQCEEHFYVSVRPESIACYYLNPFNELVISRDGIKIKIKVKDLPRYDAPLGDVWLILVDLDQSILGFSGIPNEKELMKIAEDIESLHPDKNEDRWSIDEGLGGNPLGFSP